MPRRRAQSGLTLIELLTGLALLALLLSLAAPAFQAQVATSQLSSATQALMGSLMQARTQAIRLGRRVTVCRSNDQQQCDADPARGWDAGWLVFMDVDRTSGTPEVSASDTLLNRSEPLPPLLRVRGNSTLAAYLSFAANGEARTISGGSHPVGRIRVCSTSPRLPDTRRARELILSADGRVVVETPAGVAPGCPAP